MPWLRQRASSKDISSLTCLMLSVHPLAAVSSARGGDARADRFSFHTTDEKCYRGWSPLPAPPLRMCACVARCGSPPCQPYCRVGKRMDKQDPRSTSFLHLLSLLETAENPPWYFFLENVQGFDGSQSHHRLLEVCAVSDVCYDNLRCECRPRLSYKLVWFWRGLMGAGTITVMSYRYGVDYR